MTDEQTVQQPLGIGPDAQVTHFITAARPVAIAPELLALAADARITVEWRIGRGDGNATAYAGDYRDAVRQTIARQAEGYFTLNEAAQVMAECRPGVTAVQWVRDIEKAHRAGVLSVRDCSSRLPMRPLMAAVEPDKIPQDWTAVQDMERDFSDLVTATELDAWLRKSAGYGFPPATAEPAPAADRAPPLEDHSALATRAQLIEAFGAFTGMSMAWFDKLQDTPALLKARKVDGVGARGKTREPLFCPWEVMLWLCSPKRKKGRPFHNIGKPWELLEWRFPAAYAKHSRDDPREERAG